MSASDAANCVSKPANAMAAVAKWGSFMRVDAGGSLPTGNAKQAAFTHGDAPAGVVQPSRADFPISGIPNPVAEFMPRKPGGGPGALLLAGQRLNISKPNGTSAEKRPHLPPNMLTLRRLAASFIFLLGLAAPAPAQTAGQPALPLKKISLDEAIQQALAKNFAIKISGFGVEAAKGRVIESFGKFDPVLSGRYDFSESESPTLRDALTGLRPPGTISESDNYEFSVGGLMPWGLTYSLGATAQNSRSGANAFADSYNTFAGISATQPLLRGAGFGATTASVRIAMTNGRISEWQYRDAVMNTITRVIFAYNDLQFAQAVLRSALRSRELAASLVAENEKRLKVGSTSEFDVTSARSRLANREEGIISAERQVRDAENFLKQLITDERTPELLNYGFELEPAPPAPVVVVDAAADFRGALDRRPDYQQAKLALKRSDINFKLTRNGVLPRVDLVGSYGYSGLDPDFDASRRVVRDEDFRAYSYGARVTIPLTFTAERGRYRAAKMERRQAETQLQQVEQDVVVRLGNAAGNIEATRKRLEAAKRARELAQYTLDAELKRLRAGTSSTFFVLQQQELLSGAEVSESRAISDYQKALAEYDRQLGLTLEKRNVALEKPRSS
jgi:outer membrane protein TolC